MSTKARGRISFKADGDSHTIAFTMNAMCRYQDAAGETLIAAVDALQSSASDVVRIRRLFWAGLEGDYSEADAGDVIDAIGLPKAFEVLGDAVAAAFPQGQEDEPQSGKPKAGRPPKAAN